MSWIHIPPWLKPFELKPVELTYAPRVIESFETLFVRLAYHRTWERLPEGLELLAMTAVADFDAELRGVKRHDRPFYQVMYHKRNRRRGSVCEFDAAKLQQPFRLVVCIQEHLLDTQHHEQLFRIISRIFSPAVRSERSEEYQIARRTAFKSIRKAGLRRLCKQLTIPVVATVNFSQGFDRIAPLYDLLGDIYEQQQHEASRVLVLEGIKLVIHNKRRNLSAHDLDRLYRCWLDRPCPFLASMPSTWTQSDA
ncbi:hypothetical protein Poli38472_013407 [Pythium oligandrum]|uniref:Uncharacterized protein n=1 Tax=Pythium oligandrum TaxID=41045 RepID=A0A8K1C7P6_PYTOL|nr:hypothetical protein Poli38472_013407 [Pythium oligandrum]|eukprot:TMW57933.1 hypothetical protein Poli38472_013407 [Pythium oligandrum]